MGWYIHTCFWICGPGAAKLIYLLLWSLVQPWLPFYTFDCGKTMHGFHLTFDLNYSILLAETMITHACMVDIWLTFAIVYGCHLIFGATIWLPFYLRNALSLIFGVTIYGCHRTLIWLVQLYYGCHLTFIFATIKFTCDPWMVAIQCAFDLLQLCMVPHTEEVRYTL